MQTLKWKTYYWMRKTVIQMTYKQMLYFFGEEDIQEESEFEEEHI